MKVLALAFLLAATPNNPFYADKTVPHTNGLVSCCLNKDCRSIPAWRIRNGKYELNMLGKWHTPPQRLVVTNEITPDGNAHACYTRVGTYINWYCIFIPVGMI
jgi:hypothetical protein